MAAGLRRSVSAQHLEAGAGWTALYVLRRLGIKRYPVFPLLARVWELREDLSGYDASYIALAEPLGCSVLTADSRPSAPLVPAARSLSCPDRRGYERQVAGPSARRSHLFPRRPPVSCLRRLIVLSALMPMRLGSA